MIIFWFKEAIRSILRAKSSFFFALTSTSISLFLIVLSFISINLSNTFQAKLKSSFNINLFLIDSLSESRISGLEKDLKNLLYIQSFRYINKEQAAENFIKETGEDFRKILDYNPLPSSFIVKIKDEYFEKDKLNLVISELNKLPGVEEVIYESEYMERILSLINKVKIYFLPLTVIIFLISIYIVYSTVSLILRLRSDEIETMKLVGANISSIKIPIIINGLFIGLLSGLISAAIFLLFDYYIYHYISFIKMFSVGKGMYIMILLAAGSLIGFLVSIFSLRKITLKI